MLYWFWKGVIWNFGGGNRKGENPKKKWTLLLPDKKREPQPPPGWFFFPSSSHPAADQHRPALSPQPQHPPSNSTLTDQEPRPHRPPRGLSFPTITNRSATYQNRCIFLHLLPHPALLLHLANRLSLSAEASLSLLKTTAAPPPAWTRGFSLLPHQQRLLPLRFPPPAAAEQQRQGNTFLISFNRSAAALPPATAPTDPRLPSSAAEDHFFSPHWLDSHPHLHRSFNSHGQQPPDLAPKEHRKQML